MKHGNKFIGLTLVLIFVFGVAAYGNTWANTPNTGLTSDAFDVPFELEAVIEEDANNNAMLRVIHLVSDAPAVDVWVNGTLTVDSLAYKGYTEYLSLDPDNTYNFTVVVEDTTNLVFDPVITPLMADTYYTVAAVGLLADSSQHPEIYVDDNMLSTGGTQTKFRAIHAVPDVGLVDVNLTNPATVLVDNLDYNDSSSYLTVDAGTYNVGVTAEESDSYAIGPTDLDLYAGNIYSVFAVGTVATTLELLVVVDDTSAADVRVTHAVPDAPTVDVLVNSSTAFDVLGYKQTTDYASLEVINQGDGTAYDTYNFTVIQTGTSGPAVIGPVVTPLENDTDYTIAAVGNLPTIEPLLLEDNNSPVDAGKSRIRVVHSSPNAPAVDITLTDGTVLVSDLAYKESDYIEVDAGIYDLQVRAAGTDLVALDLPGVAVEEGHVYSVYAMGYLLLPDTVTETVQNTVTDTTTVTEDNTVTNTNTVTTTETEEAPVLSLILIFSVFIVGIPIIRRLRK